MGIGSRGRVQQSAHDGPVVGGHSVTTAMARKLRLFGGRGMAVLVALAVGLAGLAASDQAFAVAGGSGPADAAYGYVVKVNVGGDRGCTGVWVDPQLVATSKECFQVGTAAPVTGQPPAASTVTTRPDQGSSAQTVAVDYLFVRDDRNLVLARLASGARLARAVACAIAADAIGAEAARAVEFGAAA